MTKLKLLHILAPFLQVIASNIFLFESDGWEMRSETKMQLLEYPIPARHKKPRSADILETESVIIDPLVSKRPEKNQNKKKNGFLCDFLGFL